MLTNQQRRLRHVTGIQIRNLTPFPVRDAFTSAITQPTDQSHFNAAGTSDDLGAMLARRRSRKISSASTATRRSLKREDGAVEQDIIVPGEMRGRTTSNSRVTFSNNSNAGNTSTSPTNTNNNISLSRSFRGHRARTNSMTSSISVHFATSSLPLGSSSASMTIPSLLPDNSQTALERVIGSRLVETFIVVTIPPPMEASVDTALSPQTPTRPRVPLRSAPASKTVFPIKPSTSRSSANAQGNAKDPTNPTSPSKSRLPPGSAPPTKTSFKTASLKQEDRANRPNLRTNGTSPNKSTPHGKGKSISAYPVDAKQVSDESSTAPAYFSPIHRPSTSPFFAIDVRSGRDFPQHCDVGGQKLLIEVWGRVSIPRRIENMSQEERRHHEVDGGLDDWKLLEEWSLDLDRLIPLPDDVRFILLRKAALSFITFS